MKPAVEAYKLIKPMSAVLVLAALAVWAVLRTGTATAVGAPATPVKFTLSSPAFTDGGTLPADFTCDGGRASPPLAWSAAPAGTQSFAVTMHHIPGPGDKHVYMVVYNIPATAHGLDKDSKDVGIWGINTVNGRQEYTPPCSKGPGPKKYTMTVYALSAAPKFDVSPDAVTMDVLLKAIKDTTLATAQMSVTYTRPGNATGQAGQDQTDGGGQNADRPRRGGPEEQALDQVTLTADETAKIAPMLEDYHQKQKKLRDDLLAQIKTVLDAEQYKKVSAAMERPPAPPAQPQGADNGPPPDSK